MFQTTNQLWNSDGIDMDITSGIFSRGVPENPPWKKRIFQLAMFDYRMVYINGVCVCVCIHMGMDQYLLIPF